MGLSETSHRNSFLPAGNDFGPRMEDRLAAMVERAGFFWPQLWLVVEACMADERFARAQPLRQPGAPTAH